MKYPKIPLGIAQQIKHPVAVVCTSGSALLNYYPAVCEAFYSKIPLVWANYKSRACI